MFRSKFTKTNSGTSEDLCLFINPAGSKKIAKLIFFELTGNKKDSSAWEIYMYPKITSNGTLIPATKLDNYRSGPNTVLLFSSPVILDTGLPFRKFILPASLQEFSTNAPTEYLEEGESILIKRTTSLGGTVTIDWTWEEIDN